MLVISDTDRLGDVSSFQTATQTVHVCVVCRHSCSQESPISLWLVGRKKTVEGGHLQHWVNQNAAQENRVMRVGLYYCPLLHHLACKSKELTGLLWETLVQQGEASVPRVQYNIK